MLHLDMESRSTCDLRKCGSYRYAQDPTTALWVISYAFDDEPVQRWWPHEKHCPARIAQHIAAGGKIAGWNSGGFERVMWREILCKRYGWPEVPLRQWVDIMTWALAMGFPGQLAQCASALGVGNQKDMAGHRLMMQMARPRKIDPRTGEITWWDDSERQQRLAQYCDQDVDAERDVAKHILPLSRSEEELWYLDQEINDRGVLIDMRVVNGALEVVERRTAKLNAKMSEATRGAVSATTKVARIGEYLREIGYPVSSLDKESIAAILDSESTPDAVRSVVELRRLAAKSSTGKLVAMQNRASFDGRARGLFMYHKAGTGRWASSGVQLHNMPRGKVDMEPLCDDLCTGNDDLVELMWGDPLDAVSKSLRGCLIPTPGCKFTVVDYSQIEARVTAYLAGQHDVVAAFERADRGEGPDFYVVAANRIGSDDRQLGKVVTLALGFGMGASKFIESAEDYGITLEARRAEEIVSTWREVNSQIKAFWYALDEAARDAVARPGVPFKARGITYRVANGHLWCQLPSKRVLCYPYPALVLEEGAKWGRKTLMYMGVSSYTRKWERSRLYGGLLCENVVQATARDVMAGAMQRLNAHGWTVTMHVHDEVIVETPLDQKHSLEKIGAIAREVPPWLQGCPVNVGGFEAMRYKKG